METKWASANVPGYDHTFNFIHDSGNKARFTISAPGSIFKNEYEIEIEYMGRRNAVMKLFDSKGNQKPFPPEFKLFVEYDVPGNGLFREERSEIHIPLERYVVIKLWDVTVLQFKPKTMHEVKMSDDVKIKQREDSIPASKKSRMTPTKQEDV